MMQNFVSYDLSTSNKLKINYITIYLLTYDYSLLFQINYIKTLTMIQIVEALNLFVQLSQKNY